jgi:hypothetical protein
MNIGVFFKDKEWADKVCLYIEERCSDYLTSRKKNSYSGETMFELTKEEKEPVYIYIHRLKESSRGMRFNKVYFQSTSYSTKELMQYLNPLPWNFKQNYTHMPVLSEEAPFDITGYIRWS